MAHQGYAGRCRVEIVLIRDGKPWNLRRTLIRGVSGGSDPVLTDNDGSVQPIREVMPQLETLDAGEGTHIIFAPQSTPLRRQPEDLSAFERTVFTHLGLTQARGLLGHLQTFADHQEFVEGDLGGKLTEVRSKLDNQVRDLTTQRGRILSSPPWASDPVPSISESEQKVRVLIEDINNEPLASHLSGVSLDALIDHAEDGLKERRSMDQGTLQRELSHLEERLSRLETLLNILEEIEKHHDDLERARLALATKLEDSSLAELRASVEKGKTDTDTLTLKQQIAMRAILLLEREPADPVTCPICATEHPKIGLEATLQPLLRLPGDHISDLAQLEIRLKQAEELTFEVKHNQEQLDNRRRAAKEQEPHMDPEDVKELVDGISSSRLQVVIANLNKRKALVASQKADRESWHNHKQSELSLLKQEELFHRIQKDLNRLEGSRVRIERATKGYEDLVAFGESVRVIQSAVKSCLTERLEEETPLVAQNLTGVFATLTRHPWYDKLLINKAKLPTLELQVASSQDESGVGHPIDVLNGQAESALALVPYFAFSQEDNAPTEVYLVMLDDPTRAFDAEHIEVLVERLAELGRNTQLIVASQETDRFRDLLPKYFNSTDYVVVEPRNWSYLDGPVLDITY